MRLRHTLTRNSHENANRNGDERAGVRTSNANNTIISFICYLLTQKTDMLASWHFELSFRRFGQLISVKSLSALRTFFAPAQPKREPVFLRHHHHHCVLAENYRLCAKLLVRSAGTAKNTHPPTSSQCGGTARKLCAHNSK